MSDKNGLMKLSDILAVEDAVYEIIEVPEWGEGAKVRVKSMSAIDRDQYECMMFKFRNEPNNTRAWEGLRARVIASCMVDADGKRIFPDNDMQWKKLNLKNAAVITRIFEVCMTISGLGAEAEGKSEGNLTTIPG